MTFDDLFVLELACNHQGSLDRGTRIVQEFARVVRINQVKAAIKLQFRSDDFVHKDWRTRCDVRYIKRCYETRMAKEKYRRLVDEIRSNGCIPAATPFDEASVDFCEELDLPFIKLASSDVNDWFLVERIAQTRRPVIASTGGSSERDVDDLVHFFGHRGITLALNHCVSVYPSEPEELSLNHIDYLRVRYPGITLGFSSHEFRDWRASMLISYAKGVRTWERHIDLGHGGKAPYCSTPDRIDEWFKAYHTAVEYCGSVGRRIPPAKEVKYLDALVRGVYAKRDLPAGYVLDHATVWDDLYLAVPLQRGQMSCRELFTGERLARSIVTDAPLMVSNVEGCIAPQAAERGVE